jgi:hypothetical protein
MGVNSTATSSDIRKFLITSNTSGQKDIRRLVVELNYEESVFDVSIRASAVVIDGGGDPSGASIKSVLEELKIAGGEKVDLEFGDNRGNTYSLELYIDEIIGSSNDTKSQTYMITLCSEELLLNESKRVRKKFEGKISDSVSTILTRDLGTSKELNVDETINKFNFLGVNYKPFYWCLSLAKKSVPFKQGQVAGYLFFENYNGYHFKAIDELFGQEPKRKFIYNETVSTAPPGFDGKIMEYNMKSNMQFQKNLSTGSYNTEKFDFNPQEQTYDENNFSFSDQEGGIKNPGKTNITDYVNSKFISEPSRYFTYMKDIGTLPEGSDLKKQLDKSAEENLQLPDIAAQATMRYQQAFTIQMEITIPAETGVNVGDIVFVDVPEVSSSNQKVPNPEEANSGLYMISELCHKLTPKRSVSKLILVRDSYDR